MFNINDFSYENRNNMVNRIKEKKILTESSSWNIENFDTAEKIGAELKRLHDEKEKHLKADDMSSMYYENIDKHIKELNDKMENFDCECEELNESLFFNKNKNFLTFLKLKDSNFFTKSYLKKCFKENKNIFLVANIGNILTHEDAIALSKYFDFEYYNYFDDINKYSDSITPKIFYNKKDDYFITTENKRIDIKNIETYFNSEREKFYNNKKILLNILIKLAPKLSYLVKNNKFFPLDLDGSITGTISLAPDYNNTKEIRITDLNLLVSLEKDKMTGEYYTDNKKNVYTFSDSEDVENKTKEILANIFKNKKVLSNYEKSFKLLESRLPSDPNIDPQFGVPSQKKYPLFDEKHVRSAIKLFGHVDAEYEQQLARAIMAKMRKYGISYDEVGPDNKLYKWIPEAYKTKK